VRISVAVTTRNRARRLERLFAALREQTLDPAQFEVVVVDDGSEDDTPAVLAHAAAQAGLQLRSIRRATSGGPGAGRNAGWRATTAPLIAFTDDDCEPQPGWLEALLAAHERDPEAFVQGPVEPHPGERRENELFTRTIRVASLGPWFQTANIAYPRALLERLGGFDERFTGATFGEDTDLGCRARALGAKAVYVGSSLTHHEVTESSYLAHVKARRRRAGAVRSAKKNPEVRRDLYGRIWLHGGHPPALLSALSLPFVLRRPLTPRPLVVFVGACTWYAWWRTRPNRLYGRRRYRPIHIPMALAADVVEVGVMAVASFEHRTLLL
jgi:GT2 family glycosyltransferase